ncbi:MAG: hypothetical protein AAF734_11185 [Bacteroidota bacterium]
MKNVIIILLGMLPLSSYGQQKADLQKVLNHAFNTPTATTYFHFDELPQRRLLIACKQPLEGVIKVGEREATISPTSAINENFFIEIQDIHQHPKSIHFKMKIYDEGVTITFRYHKVAGKWLQAAAPVVVES